MIWLALGVLAVVVVVLLVAMHESELPDELDPEKATRAAIELHSIRRRLDVSWTKTELKRDSARLRRDIAEALDDKNGDGGGER